MHPQILLSREELGELGDQINSYLKITGSIKHAG